MALLPSAVALFAAGPIIAESTHLGVQVSDLTPILLIVVLLGAGTDYGLFLIFRLREELRRGKNVGDAVAFSLCKVGESITFSGLTVIGALATVVVATFGLYKGLGPALAIGIAVALLANLTLLPGPAGRAGPQRVLAPDPQGGPAQGRRLGPHRRQGGGETGAHPGHRPGDLRAGWPSAMLAYSPTGFNNQPRSGHLRLGRGQAVLTADFPSVQTNPTTVVFRLPASVWTDPAVLAEAQRGLVRFGAVHRGHRRPRPGQRARSRPPPWPRPGPSCPRSGPADTLPAGPSGRRRRVNRRLRAYQVSSQFISADGRTIQYETALRAGPPDSTAAATAVPAVRAAVDRVGRSIGATASGVTGDAPLAADVGTISGNDLLRIIPIVMIVLALLLAIVLRSLVAPLYLVVSVGLSYLASLGPGRAGLRDHRRTGRDQLRPPLLHVHLHHGPRARTTTSWS